MEKIPTAKEMSQQLNYLITLLCNKELIQANTISSIYSAIFQLNRFQTKMEWEYIIKPSTPIKFVPTDDRKLGKIVPQIYLDVAVKPPERDDIPPFIRLDTKIEIFDWDKKNNSEGDLQSRWHIDLANLKEEGEYQAGPLFHLQAGGHKPQSNRKEELKISRPRWAIPPMELILTCEMILANFYPEQWEKIRTEKGWLKLIHIAQSMCYSAYIKRMQNCLFHPQTLTSKRQSDSVLMAFWASEWGKN
ncbi:MAG: hypothetical protein ABFS56_22290 [Pseudomonadota bacterium]